MPRVTALGSRPARHSDERTHRSADAACHSPGAPARHVTPRRPQLPRARPFGRGPKLLPPMPRVTSLGSRPARHTPASPIAKGPTVWPGPKLLPPMPRVSRPWGSRPARHTPASPIAKGPTVWPGPKLLPPMPRVTSLGSRPARHSDERTHRSADAACHIPGLPPGTSQRRADTSFRRCRVSHPPPGTSQRRAERSRTNNPGTRRRAAR